MPVLIIAISLGLGSFAIMVGVALAQAIKQGRNRRLAERQLAETGLQLSGSPLGEFTLEGKVGNTPVVFRNRIPSRLPGPSQQERIVSLLTFETPLPDFVVCKIEDQDSVIGVLLHSPRLTSGLSEFDSRYAIFAQPVLEAGVSQGFRDPPVAGALQWLNGQLLERLLCADLEWVRIREHRCELAFAPARVDEAAMLLELVAGFVGQSTRAASRPTPRRKAPELRRSAPGGALLIALTIVPAFLAGALALSSADVLRSLNSEDICGPGDHIVVLEGEWTTLACEENSSRDLTLHHVSCGLLVVAFIFGLAAILVCVRSLRHHARTDTHVDSSATLPRVR